MENDIPSNKDKCIDAFQDRNNIKIFSDKPNISHTEISTEKEDEVSPFLDYTQSIDIKDDPFMIWQQDGKIQHVDFRLKDSLPASLRTELEKLKTGFEKVNPKPWSIDTIKRYHHLIGKRQESLLDKGYGSCIFKDPTIRKIPEEALKNYDGKYFYIISCVIMPNHIHILLTMREGYDIDVTFGKLKKYCAREINKALNRQGELWEKGIFCRLIRSLDHYKVAYSYIRNNPRYINKGEFSYWEHPERDPRNMIFKDTVTT